MRFDELPAKDQAAWHRNAKATPTRARDRTQASVDERAPLWCMACGFKIDPNTDGRLDRHQKQTGHRRYEAFPTDEELSTWNASST